MNDFESYDDFCEFINDFAPYRCTERFNIPELVFRSLGICENTYAFICHLPPNIEWNEHIYHQAHVTWNQLSGGLTGTGSGSKVVFCCKSKVHETILNLPTHFKYITILRVGMNFENSANKTPISYFFDDIVRWERGENDYWIKAHIIAKPNENATLHDQHLVLNRKWWNELGSPNLFKLKFTDFERADTNFHDDYTPHWLKPKDYPMIRNFPIHERDIKVFSYNRLPTDIPSKWYKFDEIRNEKKYYPVNTENFGTSLGRIETKLRKSRIDTIDTIVSPTAGFLTEFLAKKFNIKNIVYYDLTQDHLDYKKEITDLVNNEEELKWWVDSKWEQNVSGSDYWNTNLKIKNDFWYPKGDEQSQLLYGGGKKYINGELNKNGTIDEQFEALNWVRDNCKIDYVKCDMMGDNYKEDNYKVFLPYIRDKNVLFNISNIYSYIRTHINYRFKHIMFRFDSLETFLKNNTKYFILRGVHPNKNGYLSDKSGVIHK